MNMKTRVSWVSVWDDIFPKVNQTGFWAVHHSLGLKKNGCMPVLAQTKECQSGAG